MLTDNPAVLTAVSRLKMLEPSGDPFRLFSYAGAEYMLDAMPRQIKGYCIRACGITMAVINSGLSQELQRVVAAHELGHAVLHADMLKKHTSFTDISVFGLFDSFEYEANLFASELLIDDDVMLDAIDRGVCLLDEAKLLGVPPELVDFKIRMLKYKGKTNADAHFYSLASFLKKTGDSR